MKFSFLDKFFAISIFLIILAGALGVFLPVENSIFPREIPNFLDLVLNNFFLLIFSSSTNGSSDSAINFTFGWWKRVLLLSNLLFWGKELLSSFEFSFFSVFKAVLYKEETEDLLLSLSIDSLLLIEFILSTIFFLVLVSVILFTTIFVSFCLCFPLAPLVFLSFKAFSSFFNSFFLFEISVIHPLNFKVLFGRIFRSPGIKRLYVSNHRAQSVMSTVRILYISC
mmetsp:Transcript_29574/g.26158  ORF Transcript_29574/g.26158 Transcript_29574/m.26158 type:complete len:225 (-) Transcript_29574:64-738(-)